MTKEFMEFLFENKISQDLYEWMKAVWCPEEQYWQTIIHNVQLNALGSFPGQCIYFYQQQKRSKPFVSRYQVWQWESGCKGKYVSMSCVYGVEDLPILIRRPELIAHKVYEEFEPATTFCLDYWFRKRSCQRDFAINETYYEGFPSVRYQKLKNKNDFVC